MDTNLTGGSSARLAGSVNEPHIIVNRDRTIFVPDELKSIAVQFDHNIETVTFDCPRYWDGHDFSTMRVYINYRRADGKMEPYPCEAPVVDETDGSIIHFDWTISRNVTLVKGTISFLVCVKKPNESGVLQNRWSSRLSQDMEVLEGLECSSDAIISENPDVIEYILSRLDGVPDAGGSTGEKVFVANVDETAFSDIETAIAEEKIVLARSSSGNRLHLLSFASASRFVFNGIYSGSIYTVTVDKGSSGTGVWSSSTITLERTQNKVKEIDDTATDTTYPSTKAVYIAINNMVSSIDEALLEAIGSGEVTV